MLRSYLKTGFRHLSRNMSDASINIGGLALGTAIAILIGLWVHDELTFNHYHKEHKRLAQVNKWTAQKWLPYPLAVELKENYHEPFEHVVMADPARDFIISSGEKSFHVTGQFVEPALPEMLTLELINGTIGALNDTRSVIISESTARKLFGNVNVLDKLAKIHLPVAGRVDLVDVKVAGVYRDIPHNSEFNEVKFFAPWALLVQQEPGIAQQGWDNHFVFVYTLLKPEISFEQAAPAIVEAEMNVIRHLDYMKSNADENPRVWLMPMDDWHLHSDFDPKSGSMSNGPMQFVYMVSLIGVFVLLLACINFMNLATARSEKRMREVGIRKAVGSLRQQLVGQFFSESFIVVVISFAAAIQLAVLFLPAFNDLSGKQMSMPWSNPFFWMAAAVLMTITGLLAGSYPALYLSSFRPSIVLRGQGRAGKLASWLRRVLVTIQFTVSITLIIATTVVYKQIVFAKDRNPGFARSGLIIVPARAYAPRYEAIRNELMLSGMVENVASAGGRVTSAWSQGGGFSWRGSDPERHPPAVGTLDVSPYFGRTVEWKIIAGRDFDPNIVSDSSAIIINETMAKEMGMVNPVGEVVHWKSKWHFMDNDLRVIGVVENLTMKSPYDNIMPAVFYLRTFMSQIHIRLAEGVNTSEALAKIEQTFKKVAPEVPYEFSFADDAYAAKFAYEERVGKLAAVFAALAVVISCLGLFGMASFMTERRTKEIGIRKVVGASVIELWKMMSSEFVILVALSWMIAAPISWFALSRWIESFTYRTSISWEVFAAAGAGALIVTLLTVSYRLLEAANRNPVKSLRSE